MDNLSFIKELKKTFEGRLENGSTGLTQQQAREALCLLGLNPTGLDISKFWDDLDKKGWYVLIAFQAVFISISMIPPS